MQTIVIESTVHAWALPVLIACVFSGMILYLWIMIKMETAYFKKLKKAKQLIEEGHKRAINGKTGDGFFERRRRD